MIKFLIRRLLIAIPTTLGVITLIFILLRLLPGDPALVVLGEYANETRLAELRRELGTDRPLIEQYLSYVVDVARGDLGKSIFSRQPVTDEIRQYFPYTAELALVSVVVASLIGIPLGIFSALKRNSWLDHVSRVVAMIGVSMPHFWFGLVLMWGFALNLRWFPFSGGGDLTDPVSNLRHLALPTMVLGLGGSALIARMTRSCMLEVLGQDYLRTARAKGIRERVVIIRHAFRNAMLPVVTVIGLQIGALMGGVVTTEAVFARPGLGKLLFDSLDLRDYSQAQACLLVFALILVLVNILVDITYAFLDPRIKVQ